MFIAKPVLVILFVLSIGSTAGLLFLLSQRGPSAPATPSASNTVMVSPTSVASSQNDSVSASASASPSAQLSSSAEWKTATSSALSLRLEYPADWNLDGLDSDQLQIVAPSATGTVKVRRDKKESSSAKLTTFVSSREQTYKKDEYSVKEDTSASIDDYSGNDRLFTKNEESIREITFATKNYFYTVTITPGQGEVSPVITDIIKSIRIQ